MQDRYYQYEQIDEAFRQLELHDEVLIQLPTGGGKTVEFVKIAQRFQLKNNKSALILVNRQELLSQAEKKCIDITGITPNLITSKTKDYSLCRIYIGMVGSLVSRLDLIDNVGLVIVDECRIAEFNKIHDIFKGVKIIGFDATPMSASKKNPLNNYYKTIVTGPQIRELIQMGFLAQNITRCPKDVVDSTKIAIDKLKGDYNVNRMAIEYKRPKFITNVVTNYFKYSAGKKTIVFNVNIEHSKQVNECFVLCGFNSRHLDSEDENKPSTDPRFKNLREETIAWFKETPDAILNNCMIATFGFDEPTIQTVILNFSTISLSKFLQCAGRGGRLINEEIRDMLQPEYPYPLELKNYFNIIDMGGNYARFGDWNNDRDWNYIFYHNPKVVTGIAPTKMCPECEGLVHASARVCLLPKQDGNYCEYEFEKKKTYEEQDLEEMIMVTKGIDLDNLMMKNSRKYSYYTFFELGIDVVRNMFNNYTEITDNIKVKYFKYYYKLCIDWWNKFMAGTDGNINDISESSYHKKLAKNNFDKLITDHIEKEQKNLMVH